MDALTAVLALVIAQVSLALVMIGAHLAARREHSTRYWAIASVLVVLGVLVMIPANDQRPLLQLVGSSCVVFGGIAQFWGLQAFYRKPRGKLGWAIGAGFCLLFSLLLLSGASPLPRVVLLASTQLVVFGLSCRVLLTGTQSGRSVGSALAFGGLGLLMMNNIARIATALRHDADVLPLSQSANWVAVFYLVPLGGVILYATGLLLLYFERLVEEKHQLATHDELTGLLNRRAIVAAGMREVALAIRNRQPLTVAYADIDFFKRINDELGHEAGDQVLAELAQLLGHTCRSVDLVGRLGGEEFCMIFPGVGTTGAARVGERLLAAVGGYRFRNEYPVTLSLGFASLPDSGDDQTWADLIHRADAALYLAKQAGRNRFCIAGSETAPAASAPAPA